MKQYKVILTQTEHFVVIVEAENKQQADERACEMFSNGEYDEVGDCNINKTVVIDNKTMTKQEREKKNEVALVELINKTEAINNIAIKAEPFVKQYWNMLRVLWTQPVGYNEAGRIKEELNSWELKELNKNYRALLK